MKKQLVTACKQYCLAAGATQGNIAYTQTVGCNAKNIAVKLNRNIMFLSYICLTDDVAYY